MTTRRTFIQHAFVGLAAGALSLRGVASPAPKKQLTRKVGPLLSCKPIDLRCATLNGCANGHEIILVQSNGTKDVFRMRPLKADDPRVLAKPQTRIGGHRILFYGATKLVDGVEREVEEFNLDISIPRTDICVSGRLERIESITLPPIDMDASWREVTYS